MRAAHYATAASLNQPQSFAIKLLISSLINEISFAEQPGDETVLDLTLIKSLSDSLWQKLREERENTNK